VPFNLFERFIAFRYLKPLRSGGLLSIISWFSFIGICIGVATLIIVMSVMNGFRYELENRIIGFNGHIFIQKFEESFEYDFENLEELEEIKFVDPNITIQSLITTDFATKGILVKSIVPKNIKHYSFISKDMFIENELDDDHIILGSSLARNIGAEVGTNIKLFSSNTISSPFGQLPRSMNLEVIGIFNSGMSEYDTSFAFISLKNAQKISALDNEISIIEVHLSDLKSTESVKKKIKEKFADKDLIVRDWKEINKSFWVVLSTERTVMFLILSLIIIVAAFNVITSLFILVKNKSKEIALLKTIGTDSNSILRIFLLVGSVIGVSGTIIGAILGSIITMSLENIRLTLNSLFNLNLFPSEFYYIDQIPTSIDFNEVLFIVLFSIFISVLATIFPAYSASKLVIKRILNNA
tara:strand:+ start:1347 stop:2579 length:1233 start_codon:yes stop_codon:yes gene_type:complete